MNDSSGSAGSIASRIARTATRSGVNKSVPSTSKSASVTARSYGRFADVRLDLRADGSPKEENVEVTPRQAPGDPSPGGAAGERVSGLPPAEAPASRLSELQDVQGPRRRAAHRAGSVVARIAVDAMGGDRGPAEVIAGALEASGEGIDVVLYGPPKLDRQGL